MKQLESHTVQVGDTTFYIRPFPAFTAANVLGQLTKIVTPVVGSIIPAIEGVGPSLMKTVSDGSDASEDSADGSSVLDMDLSGAGPAIASAFSTLSGDKVETMLRQLLIVHQNIAYDDPKSGKAIRLTEECANEIFCGDTQDMFLLAFEVCKVNFSGFFDKLASQFGAAFKARKTAMASTANTVG